MLPAGAGIGDEAEAQTVPFIFGIPHPTGFPAFTLAGWLFSHALPFGTVAWRLNAFTALCTSSSAAGVVLLGVAIGSDVAGAALAALAFAFGATVWNGALHANAQVLSGTFSVYALLTAVLYAQSGSTRALIAACACCGLGMAAHPAAIWVVPAILVALLWQRSNLNAKMLACATAALLLPLLLYAYLPLRSTVVAAQGLDPAAAPPVYGAGSFDWDTNAPRTLGGFLDEVLGRHEQAGATAVNALNPGRLPEAGASWLILATAQYRFWLLLLSAAGTLALAASGRRPLSILAAGAVGGIAFAYLYRDSAHLDRYVFVSFAIVAALAAASMQLVLPRVPPNAVRIVAGLALALIAGFAFAQNRPRTAPRSFADAEAIVAAARTDTPANAIVVAQWNDAAALGYGAFVEHALGARTIVSAWPYEYSDQYERWSRTRPVFLFVSPLAAERILPMWANLRERPATLPLYRVFVVVPPRAHHRRAKRAG